MEPQKEHGGGKHTGWEELFFFHNFCILSSAVKRLIASKIKVFVYIIYVSVLCIFIMYKYTHIQCIF